MAGYKLLIALLWLSIPLSGLFMLRSDHSRYLQDSRAQAGSCWQLAEHLNEYTTLMGVMAGEVAGIEDIEARREWQGRWRGLMRERNNSAAAIGNPDLHYFPSTSNVLAQAQIWLKEQEAGIERAVRAKDEYIKLWRGLEELSSLIADLEGKAGYYKRMGAEGIYLLLEEELARHEERLLQRLRSGRRLSSEAESNLEQADRLMRDILRELSHLRDKITADEEKTYRQELELRFAQFDIRSEMKQLLNAVQ
ncbi:hypothetical protein IIA79_04415 [bacterium]|nr:hypothetical protein [bacterium]